MATVSITVDQVIDALANFMTPFMQGGEVARAQTNRVPMPKAPCAILTELLQTDLSVPYSDYDPTTVTINGPTQIDIQIDIYGASSSDICKAIKAAFRTSYASDNFPDGIKPLYTSDARQTPLITGEEQYENRWTLTAYLQYNPIVELPQDSANGLALNILVDVDEQY